MSALALQPRNPDLDPLRALMVRFLKTLPLPQFRMIRDAVIKVLETATQALRNSARRRVVSRLAAPAPVQNTFNNCHVYFGNAVEGLSATVASAARQAAAPKPATPEAPAVKPASESEGTLDRQRFQEELKEAQRKAGQSLTGPDTPEEARASESSSEYLTFEQVMAEMGIDEEALERLVRTYELQGTTSHGRLRFKKADVLALKAKRSLEGTAKSNVAVATTTEEAKVDATPVTDILSAKIRRESPKVKGAFGALLRDRGTRLPEADDQADEKARKVKKDAEPLTDVLQRELESLSHLALDERRRELIKELCSTSSPSLLKISSLGDLPGIGKPGGLRTEILTREEFLHEKPLPPGTLSRRALEALVANLSILKEGLVKSVFSKGSRHDRLDINPVSRWQYYRYQPNDKIETWEETADGDRKRIK